MSSNDRAIAFTFVVLVVCVLAALAWTPDPQVDAQDYATCREHIDMLLANVADGYTVTISPGGHVYIMGDELIAEGDIPDYCL